MITLIAFAFVLLSIIASSFQLGISPMPTSKKVKDKLLECFAEDFKGTVYELGCGWGNLAIPFAKHYPKAKVIAFEKSLFPFLVAKTLSLFRPNLDVYYRDFLFEDFEKDSILICYLCGSIMDVLQKKLRVESFQGKLITHTFRLPRETPAWTITCEDLYRSCIYYYEI